MTAAAKLACPYGCPWSLVGYPADDPDELAEALAAHISAHLSPPPPIPLELPAAAPPRPVVTTRRSPAQRLRVRVPAAPAIADPDPPAAVACNSEPGAAGACDGGGDTPVPRRRRKWQANAKLTEQQVRALHRMHVERGMSMRELARQGWERWGYASEKSCLVSVLSLMDSLGLERRDRIDAVVRASTTHGMASRAANTDGSYKRWRRATVGPWPSDTRSAAA